MKIERMAAYQREKLGLGLSLVHHLVSARGSDLRYEIVAGETMTEIWFLLPMSLDYPERLNADDMQVNGMQTSASRPLNRHKVAESIAGSFSSTSPTLPLTTVEAAPQFLPATSTTPTSTYSPAIGSEATTATAAAALPKEDEGSKIITEMQPKQYPEVAPGARPLVLVVEDTDVCASLLSMHLRKLNCTSHRAENGEVAIEMLRSAPDPSMYNLILMDLRMPVMDGFETATIKLLHKLVPGYQVPPQSGMLR